MTAPTYTRVNTPTASSSLRWVSVSATHLLRLDGSSPSILVDLRGKKPITRVVPLEGFSHPRSCFSRDGKHFFVLDAATAGVVRVFDVETLAMKSFELKRGWHLGTHPVFPELLVVTSDEGTDLVTAAGKVVRSIPGASSISPDGAWCIVKAGDDDRVCALTDKGPASKGHVFSASNFAWSETDAKLLTWAWGDSFANDEWKGKPGLSWLDAKTGKKTFFKSVTFSKDSSSGIDDLIITAGWAVSVVEGGIADHPIATVDFVKLSSGARKVVEVKAGKSHTFAGAHDGRVAVAVNWQPLPPSWLR